MKRIYFVFLLSISFGILHAELPNSIWGITLGDSYEKVESVISNSSFYRVDIKTEKMIVFYYDNIDEWNFLGEKFNYMKIEFENNRARLFTIFPNHILYNRLEWSERTQKVWYNAIDSYPNCEYDPQLSEGIQKNLGYHSLWAVRDNEDSDLLLVIMGGPIDEKGGITAICLCKL